MDPLRRTVGPLQGMTIFRLCESGPTGITLTRNSRAQGLHGMQRNPYCEARHLTMPALLQLLLH